MKFLFFFLNINFLSNNKINDIFYIYFKYYILDIFWLPKFQYNYFILFHHSHIFLHICHLRKNNFFNIFYIYCHVLSINNLEILNLYQYIHNIFLLLNNIIQNHKSHTNHLYILNNHLYIHFLPIKKLIRKILKILSL